MKKLIASTFFTLLFIPLTFSQSSKTEQVHTFLGEVFKTEKPKGKVMFRFQRGDLTRMGDGTKTFAELLPNAFYYSDAPNAGEVWAVTVNDVPVDRAMEAPPVAATTKDTTKVKGGTKESGTPPLELNDPRKYHFRDSAELEKDFAEKRVKVSKWTQGFWKAAKPTWKFFMWLFGLIGLPCCVLAIGLLWMIASTSAGESLQALWDVPIFGAFMVGAHRWSSAGLICFLWAVAGVLCVNAYLWLIWWDVDFYLVLVLWGAIIGLCTWIIKKMVPNPSVVIPRGSEVIKGNKSNKRLNRG